MEKHIEYAEFLLQRLLERKKVNRLVVIKDRAVITDKKTAGKIIGEIPISRGYDVCNSSLYAT